ncbi:MAG: hypothetical protein Kow0074_20250 [Candidatus Zixiibacteriota bacterium]
MTHFESAWAIRPFPHGKYRIREFVEQGMAAIGWPAIGDMSGRSREDIRSVLRTTYYKDASAQALGQATGIIDRFVNQIHPGNAVLIPDAGVVYIGEVTRPYYFRQELSTDEEGYPHWVGVKYLFDGQPIARSELPALLFDALKGRQSVFSLPSDQVEKIVNDPTSYRFLERLSDIETKSEYVRLLSQGRLAGVNSNQLENSVRNLLALYFPGLERLATKNAPAGADTDLMSSLPGGVIVRVQVKCFQDAQGSLESSVVDQLRKSMEPGEHGIIVTTGKVCDAARQAALAESDRPIGIIDGSEFAELVFDNIERLTDQDLWNLGLRRSIAVRG